jgi:hypothetical protein
MADVEVLCDVRRRVLDDDFLACAGCVRSVLRLTRRCVVCELVHLRQYSAEKRGSLQHEMQERLVMRDGLDKVVRLELGEQHQHKYGEALRAAHTWSMTVLASTSTFPGRRKRGSAIVKSTPFFP